MAEAGFHQETFEEGVDAAFWAELTQDDGSAFPWAEYEFEYFLEAEGCGPRQRLTVDNGIHVAPEQNAIAFSLGSDLRPGRYRELCRARHIATDQTIPIFNGTIIIRDGAAR